MFTMPRSPFSQFLFDAFLDWEKSQPGERSNFSKFAEYLGVKQQALSSWINDRTNPNPESAELLSSKLGKEIYNVLNLNGRDPDLAALASIWQFIPEEGRHTLRVQGERYVAKNETSPSRRQQSESTS